jgi:GPH family glycoside/pentoside/hexuronide:cation symporter
LSLPLKGRAGKLAYAVGAIGDTGFTYVINTFLLVFLTDYVKLDIWLSCLTFAISFGVWNAINDPIIGLLSDRTRTRFGRRRPFILIGAPLTILFFVLLWLPPTGGKSLTVSYDIGVFLFITIILGAWAWTYSMAAVTWFALYPEMWESVKERSEVVVYRQIFALFGGILAVAVFPLLRDIFSEGTGGFDGWIWAGVILGCIFAGAYLFSLLGIRERKEFLEEKPLSMGKSITMTFTNKTLLTYVIIDLMTWCMMSWLSITMPFFAKCCLHIEDTDVALLMGPFMLGTLTFFIIWRKAYIRYGPKTTLATAAIGFTLAYIPCLFVQTIFQGALWAFSLGAVMSGILLAREVMMGDVVDEDELKTGVRREGSYFGAFMAIEKMSFLIAPLSAGLVLSSIGYDSQSITESMNMGLRIGMVIFTAIYSIVLFVFLWFYPLGKEKASKISKEIEKLHKAKEKKLEKTAKAKKA